MYKGKIGLTIKEICSSFNVEGDYVSCEEVPTGNINSTFKVEYNKDGDLKHYIVQKINKNVFKQPEKVMDNIIRVTDYVRQRIEAEGLPTRVFVLRAFTTRDTNLPYVIDSCGEYWRCYRFIKNSRTFDTCDNLEIIEQAGSAFGKFQNYLDGFDTNSLNITIPNFHNTIERYKAFHDAIEKDSYNRVKKVKKQIQTILNFEEKACQLQKYLDEGKIKVRVAHNDTKFNNVSFDAESNQALAVLDLDTVMPGAVAHDFGDAIRFIANTVIEDCPDISKVSLDVEKYEAFAKGFISEVRDMLTEQEKQSLNLGVFVMTIELAVRFLSDYICGDKYFKTKYPGHNLDRANNQLALAIDIDKKLPLLDEIIKKYF